MIRRTRNGVDQTERDSEKRTVQRMEQIEKAKKEEEYQRYITEVPVDQREPENPAHPTTPRWEEVSRGKWSQQFRHWRSSLTSYWIVEEQLRTPKKECTRDCKAEESSPEPEAIPAPKTFMIDNTPYSPGEDWADMDDDYMSD